LQISYLHIKQCQWQGGTFNTNGIDIGYLLTCFCTSYAHHNDYVGFKKIVHDAHYPDDQAPPMPNASTWFPSESPDPTMPNTRSAVAGATEPIDDDDEDLAVASERISIKCPITLLPMKDPVTSQKCPHSFEKEAILSMIGDSDVWVGGSGRRGDGQKGMKCPVCEMVCHLHDT